MKLKGISPEGFKRLAKVADNWKEERLWKEEMLWDIVLNNRDLPPNDLVALVHEDFPEFSEEEIFSVLEEAKATKTIQIREDGKMIWD